MGIYRRGIRWNNSSEQVIIWKRAERGRKAGC